MGPGALKYTAYIDGAVYRKELENIDLLFTQKYDKIRDLCIGRLHQIHKSVCTFYNESLVSTFKFPFPPYSFFTVPGIKLPVPYFKFRDYLTGSRCHVLSFLYRILSFCTALQVFGA